MLLRLVLGNLLARRARTILTAMSIAVAVALVVGMTSGFKAFETAAGTYMDQYMGAVDANIYRTQNQAKGLDRSLFDEIAGDPQVRLAFPRLNSDAPLLHNTFANPLTAKASMVGVNRATDPLLGFMKINRGRWFAPGEMACVIDEGLFKARYGKGTDDLDLPPGETLAMKGQFGPLELPIVGVVHKPGIFAGFMQTVYVPLEAAQKFVFGPDSPAKTSEIRVQVKPGTDLDAFNARWTERLKTLDPDLKFKLARQARENLDKNFFGLRLLSALGGAVAMLAAMFIIFSTLSMGVAERQRTLAMMRAIGTTRRQIAAMVLIEGVLISFIGVVIGIPLGYGLSAIVVEMMKPMFQLTPALDWLGVILAGAGALAAAVVAGQIPAWQATRVDPIEAMNPLANAPDDHFPWRATIVGFLLILIDPIMLFFPIDSELARSVKFYAHLAIGLPTLLVGFFLIAPAFIWLITHLLGPLLCAIFRAPFSVVSQQISGGRWRSAGTCASLMVGLGVLIVMETQGNSSLKAWQLPNRFPDIFVFTRSLTGLSPSAQQKIAASPMLKADDVMPIGAFSPEVGPGILGLMGTQLPGNTMFIAVDPDKAFRIMELDFREGNPQDASRLLKQGRHVVVTLE
ncbi:MAG: ABC transporter permease, partial [Burkholderiales bacterium]|nr:ABC transporter permease [Phycisphaerae bacterium]